MQLEVKRSGEVVMLTDSVQIVKRNRSFTLVIDQGRAFEIMNESKKRKAIIDRYMASRPEGTETVTIVRQPTQTQQQAEDSAKEISGVPRVSRQ